MAQQKRNEAAKKSGAGHVFAVIGKVIGTVFLTAFLAFLIFACLFAVYVKNDLSQQAEWAADSFSLDQTSVIYYENPETGKYEVLQTLYGGSNSTWVEYDDIPKNPRVHRRAGAHALVKDRGLAPLDIIAAHEADDGGIPAQLLPDRGQLPRVAEMEGVIFTDHADRLHKRPSDKKILGNSCFPFAFVV